MQGSYNEFQVGNWVVYRPEGNYCMIKSLSPNLILEGVLQNYISTYKEIDSIEITGDKLQVCGFDVQYPKFIKISSNNTRVVILVLSRGVYRLYKNDEEFCNVRYIHEVQNSYYKITGETLRGNLYGVQEG